MVTAREARVRSRVIVFETNSDGEFTAACRSVAVHGTPFVTMNPQFVREDERFQYKCSAWVISPKDEKAYEWVVQLMEALPPAEGFDKAERWDGEAQAIEKMNELFGPGSTHYAFRSAVDRGLIRFIGNSFLYKGKRIGRTAQEAQNYLIIRKPKLMEEIKAAIEGMEKGDVKDASDTFEAATKHKVIVRKGAYYMFGETRLATSKDKTKELLNTDASLLAQVKEALVGID